MSQVDTPQILLRIGQLTPSRDDDHDVLVEKFQGTTTIARVLYGDRSPQLDTLLEAAKSARNEKQGFPSDNFRRFVKPVITGTLAAMKADVEFGLVGKIELRAAGEVLADMLGLAKEALAKDKEGAKNVAAVLTAAAYEDAIRKMGTSLAGVTGRPDLDVVMAALKTANVLVGAPLTTALGYMKFRNDALHADWTKLDRPVVGSCLAFVEGLVLKHLS